MMSVKRIHKRIGCGKGATLVELVIAAAIMLIAIVAIVGVVRMGADTRMRDLHKKQARAVIMSVFERSFAFDNFKNTYTVINPDSLKSTNTNANPNREQTRTFTALAFGVNPPLEFGPFTVFLNKRRQTDLLCTLRVEVSEVNEVVATGVTVPMHEVTAWATWREFDDDGVQRIELSKRLTNLGL